MNIALPLHFGRPGSEGTFPRQDVTLDEPVRRWVAKDEVRCPGGEIETSLTITELTPIRIVLGFREDRQDCGAGVDPVCTIDFAYSLVRPACLPPEDPACARNIRFELASGLWQPVECTCQR